MAKFKIAVAALVLAAANTAQADFIGATASVDYWQYDTDQSGFQLDDDQTVAFSVSIEHPIPVLPNAKIKYANLNSDNLANGQNLDLDYADFILYYELLDNVVSVDVGAGVKSLEGDLAGQKDLSETLPMIYAQAGVKLPFTGLSATAEADYAKSSDYDVTDAEANIKYNFIDNLLVDVAVKGGYRILKIENDQKAMPQELEFKGPYLGVEVHF